MLAEIINIDYRKKLGCFSECGQKNMPMNTGYSLCYVLVFPCPVITVIGQLLQPQSNNIQEPKGLESSE